MSDLDLLTEKAIGHLQPLLAKNAGMGILVNPFSADPLGERLTTLAAKPDGKYPLQVNPQWLAGHPAPYVLWLSDCERQFSIISASIHVAAEERLGLYGGDYQTRSICAWLTPAQPDTPQTFAKHLSRGTTAINPNGQRIGFRFHDPRITLHLPGVLAAEQWQALAGPCAEAWYLMDEECIIRKIEADTVTSDGQVDRNGRTSFLQFSSAQWQALLLISHANRMAQLAPQWDIPQRPEFSSLLEIARRAQDWMLVDEADRLTFARHVLRTHPRLDEHPTIQSLLRNHLSSAKGGEPTNSGELSDQLDSLDDLQWQRIQADLAASTPPPQITHSPHIPGNKP